MTNQETKKLLIIDDDAELSNMYGMKFEMHWWDVHKAHDGVSWLRDISTFKPDVVLLDVMMPGLDGFQTLKFVEQKLQAEKIHCKVIMFTNLNGNDVESKALSLGAAGFLMKANATPKEAVSYVNSVLIEDEQKDTAGFEADIEEDGGRYFADCPGCGVSFEIILDEEWRPSKIKAKR